MKMIQKILLPAVLCISANIHAAIIYWDGGGDGSSWNDNLNWNGDMIPGTTDDVVLDNSVVIINYIVNLPSGNVSTEVNSLVISPSFPQSITLLLPASNTSSAGFLASGPGDAVILNNGAVFKNSSGATSGTTVSVATTAYFRINNGGLYTHNTPRAHAGLVARLSSVPGTEDGTFMFDVPGAAGYVLSLTDRIFGNLVLSGSAAGGNKSYVANGTKQVTVNGGLRLQSGAKYSHSISNDIIVKGSLSVDTGSLLDISTGINNTSLAIAGTFFINGNLTESGTANPQVIFNGVTNQDITIGTGGTISGDGIILKINNSAGITLQSALPVPYEMLFVNGYVQSTEENIVVFKDNAISSGAGPASHVNGPVMKEGDEDFEFPVGDNGHYMPLALINPAEGSAAATDTFIVEYFRDNPQYNYGNMVEIPALDHISSVEYWKVNRKKGIASKYIQLAVAPLSFVTDHTALDIAAYDGSGIWINNGRTTVTGNFSNPFTGNITGNLTSSFGPFTLASELPAPVNPLPVQFINVNVQKKDKNGLISWEINGLPTNGIAFQIEKSMNGADFRLAASIHGTNKKRYEYTDKQLLPGISYYRVKAEGEDGAAFYSAVVKLNNADADLLKLSVSPSFVETGIKVHILSPVHDRVLLLVYDMNGRLVMQQPVVVNTGNNDLVINAGRIAKGNYILLATSGNAGIVSTRFVKQ